MSQYLISFSLISWLVVATLLFIAIVWRVFRPATRVEMERRARIPFEGNGGER